jgi:transcriptional regulator with XRE-family HTH domain
LAPAPPLRWEAWRAHVRCVKQERQLSIATITGRSGLDRSTVIELLNGRRGVADVRIGTLWALAWALEVSDFAAFIRPLIPLDASEPLSHG